MKLLWIHSANSIWRSNWLYLRNRALGEGDLRTLNKSVVMKWKRKIDKSSIIWYWTLMKFLKILNSFFSWLFDGIFPQYGNNILAFSASIIKCSSYLGLRNLSRVPWRWDPVPDFHRFLFCLWFCLQCSQAVRFLFLKLLGCLSFYVTINCFCFPLIFCSYFFSGILLAEITSAPARQCHVVAHITGSSVHFEMSYKHGWD